MKLQKWSLSNVKWRKVLPHQAMKKLALEKMLKMVQQKAGGSNDCPLQDTQVDGLEITYVSLYSPRISQSTYLADRDYLWQSKCFDLSKT